MIEEMEQKSLSAPSQSEAIRVYRGSGADRVGGTLGYPETEAIHRSWRSLRQL